MKCYIQILLGVLTVSLATCEYEVPLSPPQGLKVDPNVIGHWQFVEDPPDSTPKRMLVLKNTDTEYLIHYPTGKDGLYFRGYPLKVGGVSCVQIQLIGTAKGDIKEKDRRFHVIHYTAEDKKLVIKTLNSKVVSGKLKKSAELEKAFLKNKDHKELWHDPGTFKKIDLKD